MAVLIAGLAGAAALPLTSLGVGWALVAVILLAATLRGRARPRPAAIGLAVAAVVLVGVGAWRAAPWLFLLCLAAALLLASLAAGGPLTWRGLLLAPRILPSAAVTGLREDLGDRRDGGGRDGSPPRPGPRALLGWLVALVAVTVFGALFTAADGVFARFLAGLLPGPGEIIRAVGGFTVAALLGVAVAHLARRRARDLPTAVGSTLAADTTPPAADPAPPATGTAASAAVTAARPGGSGPAARPGGRTRRGPLLPGEWVPTLALLDLLFGAFVAVQVTTWFRGHAYVLDPAGPSYAEYARGGFGQLLTVTLLTLGVVAVLAAHAARDTPGRRLLLRALGGILCLFTLVVVASAVTRMALYVQAYGFTRPRLLADALVLWLGVVFVVILVAGVRLRARWLPHALLGSALAVLGGLVAVDPDALVARTVIGRFEQDGHLDASYLAMLSADAAAELDRLPEPQRSCALGPLADRLREPDPWYAFNLSRARARELLDARPPQPGWQARCSTGTPDPYQRGG
ncbi:hypothetical protein CS0771_16870 [Catellatospora sp. IY07-71]|uniref:DUF4153 domain-containing protein n=1 Tax=Catellatospora sp. IY07-71 TaxID=2728827 RepID=UPI001BB35509|nr:DUF4173 domain-containing protein [Catellatospora sp. IY07-71]BCJ72143.1 hypothetical protein CS0771_16870 [Catellatospora sp. IY07-71]